MIESTNKQILVYIDLILNDSEHDIFFTEWPPLYFELIWQKRCDMSYDLFKK